MFQDERHVQQLSYFYVKLVVIKSFVYIALIEMRRMFDFYNFEFCLAALYIVL